MEISVLVYFLQETFANLIYPNDCNVKFRKWPSIIRRMPLHPVIINYTEAEARLKGRDISIPTIASAAYILTTQGADKIYIPIPVVQSEWGYRPPNPMPQERAKEAVAQLDNSLRKRVRLVDENGATLRRVLTFLEPLGTSVSENSVEQMFVGFAMDMLYHMALASQFGATSIDGDMLSVQDFISRIRLNSFRGEARTRAAEIIYLAAIYEPYLVDKLKIVRHAAEPGVKETLDRILESAEFQKVVETSGRLGYLRRPRIGLRRLRTAVWGVLGRKDFRFLLDGLEAVSTIATAQVPEALLKDITAISKKDEEFSPLFGTLHPFDQLIFESALNEFDSRCTHSKGNKMILQPYKVGICGARWLPKSRTRSEYSPKKSLSYAKAIAERARDSLFTQHVVRSRLRN